MTRSRDRGTSLSSRPSPISPCGLSVSLHRNAGGHRRLPITVNGHSFLIGFDPSVAVDASGTYHYCYGVSDGSGNGANAIAVASSPNGLNWTPKTPVTFNSGGQFDDKYWIAADSNKTGTLYVGWDRNKGNNQTLFCAVSTNGGNSWTAPIKVYDGTTKFERVIYAADIAPLGSYEVGPAYWACGDGLNFWVALFSSGNVARF
jgi:hypothetical protein